MGSLVLNRRPELKTLIFWIFFGRQRGTPNKAPKCLKRLQTKAHVSEVGKQVSKTATEVHGGMGFTDELGLHYWFKRIGLNRQLLGSPELVREEAGKLQGFDQ